ncbi:MAG: hypothetical protein ACKPFD_07010 [Dolichospermum sp.]
MKFKFDSKPQLTLHGYSPETPIELFNKVVAGAKPSSLKGDFVLIAEGYNWETGKPLTVFVSTVVNEKLLDFDKANLEQKGWHFFITIGAVSEFLQKNGIQKA